jgi:DNA-binding NarL/FixJ family response regulator
MTEVMIMSPVQERRDLFEDAIRADASLHFAGSAATFPLLRSMIDQVAVDVCIVDITATTQSEAVQEWLRELRDLVPLVILGSAPDPWIFSHILRADRGALLATDASVEQIICAVRSTAAGMLSLDRSMVPEPEAAEEIMEELTPREIDVLRLLAEGFANREIASRLDISEHTIKFHIRSILAKLGASTRTEAVTRGLRAGLIEL